MLPLFLPALKSRGLGSASNPQPVSHIRNCRASRHAFLDLDLIKLKGLNPLTEPMVAEFANAARLKLDATQGIAELGTAVPKGTLFGHAPGTSVIRISGSVNISMTVAICSENREENMFQFTEAALALFNTALSRSF